MRRLTDAVVVSVFVAGMGLLMGQDAALALSNFGTGTWAAHQTIILSAWFIVIATVVALRSSARACLQSAE